MVIKRKERKKGTATKDKEEIGDAEIGITQSELQSKNKSILFCPTSANHARTTRTIRVLKRMVMAFTIVIFFSIVIKLRGVSPERGAPPASTELLDMPKFSALQATTASTKLEMPQISAIAAITNSNSSWPGKPVNQLGAPLVIKCDAPTCFTSEIRALFLEHLDEFLEVYKNSPDPVNLCGIRIMHAFALYITIKKIKPTAIIESGINAGVSTYIMRAAAGPETQIFAMDPLEKPICAQGTRWIDTNPKTQYFVGKTFQDFGDKDWAGLSDAATTLVYFDDHQAFLRRMVPLQRYGFRHVLLEDNYRQGEGATPPDKRFTPKQKFLSNDADGKYLFSNLVTYFEFPPLLPPIMAKENINPKKAQGGFLHHTNTNEELTEPLLRPDRRNSDMEIFQRLASELKLSVDFANHFTFMQFMSYTYMAYMEVLPMSPELLLIWDKKV